MCNLTNNDNKVAVIQLEDNNSCIILSFISSARFALCFLWRAFRIIEEHYLQHFLSDKHVIHARLPEDYHY